MKKLLLVIFLLISTNCYSAGPQKINYSIDGIKVGDSLKKLYSKSEINEFERQDIKDGKYYLLARLPSEAFANAFSVIQFAVKKGDPDMYVYAVAAIRLHQNDLKGCLNSKKSLIDSVIKKDFKYVKVVNSERPHPTHKGKTFQSEFLLDYGNIVRVYCVDFKSNQMTDHMRFEILNKDYHNWYNK